MRMGTTRENEALIATLISQLRVLEQGLDSQISDLIGVRRGLEKQSSYYQNIISQAPNGLIVADSSRLILEANAAAAAILKVESASELLGELLDAYLVEEDRESFLGCLQEVIDGGRTLAETEVSMQGQDGDTVRVGVRIVYEPKIEPRLALFISRVSERYQNENAVIEREQFRLLAENVSEIIFTADSFLNLTFVSPSVTTLLGYTQAEAIALGVGGLFVTESAKRVYSVMEEELGSDRDLSGSSSVEVEMLHKDGSTIWTEFKARALCSLEPEGSRMRGKLQGFVCIAMEKRDRLREEEAERGMGGPIRSIYHELPVAMVLYDAEGYQVSTNRVFGNVPGVPMEGDVAGTQPSLFDAPWLPETAKAELRAGNETRFHSSLDSERAIVLGLCDTTKTEPVEIDLVITPLMANEGGFPCGYLAQMQDVTGRKIAYQQLQGMYEHEVQLRQTIEVEMNKRLEFTRALAHELKTPLTAVLASSTALAANLREGLPLDLARSLVRGAYRLSSRINEFLDLACGELGILTLNKRSVEPTRILTQVAEELSDTVSNLGQSMVLDIPDHLPPIWADEDRLKQVILSLLDNASQYSGKGSKITLSARLEYDRFSVEVRDTGRGILPEERGGLFEPYRPREVGGKRTGGLGMGLPLSKMIIDLHGGQIGMRTEDAAGTIFSFWIPAVDFEPLSDSR